MLYKLQRYDFSFYNKVYFIIGDNDSLTKGKCLLFIEENSVKLDKEK